ncbi:nitrate reductase molybdenum cofactor assembly chaperone [Paucibacter sp. AS339]|uniref:nitrate reductase molybdenum cofactor assembly chaperone n=1 Tax=Paucibacter hankyongi TaxID=3133434 RepID=UPI003095334A
MKTTTLSKSCRVLARLLDYPHADMRAALPELYAALSEEGALSQARLAEVKALMATLQQGDAYAVEARYVETFDRGRSTSLHMFEHVHGDSRERGPALIDLQQTYAAGGMFFEASELPDYLPVVLEFASTQAAPVAREFLAEMAHILNAIHSALIKRPESQGRPYAAAIGAVLELAGEKPQAVQITVDEALDEAWQEPAAFDGCSSKGQSKPGVPQPIHIVRKTPAQPGVQA